MLNTRRSTFALAVLLVAAPAAARQKLVLAPLRAGPGLPTDSQLGAQILNYIAESLGDTPAAVAAFEVVPPAQTRIQFFSAGCYEPGKVLLGCMGQFGKETGADWVLFGTLSLVETMVERKYKVDLRALRLTGGVHTLSNAGAEGTVIVATDWSDAVEALRKPLLATLKLAEAMPAISAPPPPAVAKDPEPRATSGLTYAAWGTGAAGALALAAGAWFGYQAGALKGELSGRYKTQARYYPADEADLQAVGDGNTRANILFGVGAALAATSGALFFAAPAPGGGATLSLSGRF